MRDGLHLGGPGHYGTFPIRRRNSRGKACTLVVQDIMVLSKYEGDVHERWLAPWWSRTLWYFHNTKEKFMRDGLHLGGPGHYGTFTIRRRSSRGVACTLVFQDIMILPQYEGEVHMRDGLHLGGPGHYGTFTIRRRCS